MIQNRREQKAIQIVLTDNSITRITRNHYRVISQTDVTKSYDVKKMPNSNVWTCTCIDFLKNLRKPVVDKNCKHILAVMQMYEKLEFPEDLEKPEIEPFSLQYICKRCESTKISRNGYRILKNGKRRQIFICTRCQKVFTQGRNGFQKVQSDPTVIVDAVSLFMAGLTYNQIVRHIAKNYQMSVARTTVGNWIIKYTELMTNYLKSLEIPELGNVWCIDETVVKVKNTEKIEKGFVVWLWSIIDPKTRFVISTQVSKKREIKDAKAIIEKGKQIKSPTTPNYIITDSLHAYEQAIRQQFDETKIAHIKTLSIGSGGFANYPIERWHNELKSNLKKRRGLGNDESAQTYSELSQIDHNYIRPHEGLNGKTPAEVAGIDLGLGSDKLMDLIKLAAEHKELKEQQQEKDNELLQIELQGIKSSLETQLHEKRSGLVTIVTQFNSIKVIPKQWIEKRIWREINDILILNGFNWLADDKIGCWIKILSTSYQ